VAARPYPRPCAPTPTIYIVDDDDAVRESLRFLLDALGVAVADFAGAAGVFARGPGDEGKCLILDVNLPACSGLEILARLRAEGSALPVVMVSGDGDAAARRRAAALGAVAFLDKPVDLDRLLGALAAALGPAQAVPP